MYDAFRKIIKYEGVKGLYKVGTEISVYSTVVNKPFVKSAERGSFLHQTKFSHIFSQLRYVWYRWIIFKIFWSRNWTFAMGPDPAEVHVFFSPVTNAPF